MKEDTNLELLNLLYHMKELLLEISEENMTNKKFELVKNVEYYMIELAESMGVGEYVEE